MAVWRQYPRLISCLVMVTVVTSAISVELSKFAYDDAFIHFRIAENFWFHGVPYYNLGSALMATSSPIWTAILAILVPLPGELSLAVAISNGIITALGAYIWCHLLQKCVGADRSKLYSTIFFVSYIGALMPSAVGLMETPLAVLMVGIAGIQLLENRKSAWFFLSICIYVRYELAVVLGVAVIFQIAHRRQWDLQRSIYLLVPIIIPAAALEYYFGGVLPHPATAKQVIYSLSFDRVARDLLISIAPWLKWVTMRDIMAILGLLILSATALALAKNTSVIKFIRQCQNFSLCGLQQLSNFQPSFPSLMCFAGVLIGSTYVYKQVFLHPWYVPLYLIPFLFYFFFLANKRTIFSIAALVLAAPTVTTAAHYSLAAISDAFLPGGSISGARVQRYKEVGTVLYDLFPASRLMTSEIGGLGASFKGEILDGVGLASPEALKHHPLRGSELGIGGIPKKYIEEEAPELIVSYPVFLNDIDPIQIQNDYVLIKVPALSQAGRNLYGVSSIWGSKQMHIYIIEEVASPYKLNQIKARLAH